MNKLQKVMLMCLVAFVLLLACIKLVPVNVNEGFVEYIVKPGDTIWGIASEHYHLTNTGMCFEEYQYNLRKINKHLHNKAGGLRYLQPGDRVIVPIWTVAK